MARELNELWCADLAYVDKLASDNSGTKYLLVVVDVLSRFVRVQPMRNKKAVTTREVFIKLLGVINRNYCGLIKAQNSMVSLQSIVKLLES